MLSCGAFAKEKSCCKKKSEQCSSKSAGCCKDKKGKHECKDAKDHEKAEKQEAPKSNSPFQFPANRAPYSPPPPRRSPSPDYRNDTQQQNEDALVLVRAMINAAKSDGEITQEEQQSILERIGNPTQDVIDFLRQEFSQPLDVREFAWSVPLGMEQKVYTLSLAAIEINQNSEATYLRDLAHGLRLSPEVCNQIHQQFNAPTIF